MIIGIDLGTTYSLCSCYKDGAVQLIPNGQGAYMTPSVVHFNDDNTFYVGNSATKTTPHSFRYFKEFMGTTKTFPFQEKEFTPVELSAFVLKQLKADAEAFLGYPVTEAIISVPAYFNDNQRIATKQAGQLAGLNTLRIVNEPSAAALAHRMDDSDATMLVFDFGGGTLDVSVVDSFENIIEILAIAGDNHLGGKTVDDLLATAFCSATGLKAKDLSPEEHTQFMAQIEQVKITLSTQDFVSLSFLGRETIFTKPLLLKLLEPLFDRMKQIIRRAVTDSDLQLHEIDKVILVGGSSQLVGLSQFLADLIGIPPALTTKPQEVVATGMGYYVGIKLREEEVEDFILTDVCPFTLGVAVVDGVLDNAPHVSPIIPRNTTLPASRTHTFSTVHDGQESIKLSILQGEAYYKVDNLLLEEITFPVTAGAAGSQNVNVTFTYDLNGILQVEITHENTGRTKLHTIVNQSIHYSDYDLQEAIKSIEQYKLSFTETTTPLLKHANLIYSQCAPAMRDTLRILMMQYNVAKNQSLIAHRKAHAELVAFLEDLEAQQEHFMDRNDDDLDTHPFMEDFDDLDDLDDDYHHYDDDDFED